ncbi:hypothetical protein M885DRAFT_570414 [Pelagophyceae sp. CCMP2097]|nr:hypothetical protein M885DRAFT_570414 [Pelagophyceae sp. CCMP2097]
MLARALRPRPAAHLRRAAATRAQAAPRRAPALIGAASCAALGVCGAAAYADGAPLDRIQSFLFGSPAVAHSALDGGIVTVLIEEEVLAELPEMALDDVLRNGRSDGGDGVLLCTYQGIVYDVTAFASAHPGGRELLLTACGSDLGFYFANYTVHGASSKAAEWLAPLAVAKLSRADAVRAAALSTASCHVEKRMARLGAARRKLLCLALCLPAAIALRSLVRAVKRWVSTTVATWLAEQLPFAVPGVSPGAEMVEAVDSTGKKRKVAVVGGGVAGCGAAWMLAQSGYDARSYTSGNARTFDWDGFAATVEGNVAERPKRTNPANQRRQLKGEAAS